MCPTLFYFYFLTLHMHKCPITIDGNLLNVDINVFVMKTVGIFLSVFEVIFSPIVRGRENKKTILLGRNSRVLSLTRYFCSWVLSPVILDILTV